MSLFASMLVFPSVLGGAYHERNYMREDLSEEHLKLLKIRWTFLRGSLSAGVLSVELYGSLLYTRPCILKESTRVFKKQRKRKIN